MRRRTFDILVSTMALFLAVILLVAGGLATWTNVYISDQVEKQLSAQKVFFPAADDPEIAGPEYDEIRQYGGQQLTTGEQAKAYADHFIAVHLEQIGGGKTYSELSAQAQANPDDAELAATVGTLFRGETLRGLLLNAYAFGTMATIAGWAALAAYIGAAVLLILGLFGFWHARRTPRDEEILAGRPDDEAAPVGG
jgi:hypothetical protein